MATSAHAGQEDAAATVRRFDTSPARDRPGDEGLLH